MKTGDLIIDRRDGQIGIVLEVEPIARVAIKVLWSSGLITKVMRGWIKRVKDENR